MAEIIKPLKQNIMWASSGVNVQPPDIKYIQGWVVEQPPYQYFNYVINKIDVTLASINQHGYPTWDNETEYRAGVSYTLLNGVVYFCKVTHTNQNPSTDVSEVYWRPILNGQKLLPASSVSTYMLPLLNSGNSDVALTYLGGTTTGKALFKSTTQLSARSYIGADNASNITLGTLNQARLPFQPVQQGEGAGQLNNKVYIGWSGSNLLATVDTTALGSIAFNEVLPQATESFTGAVRRASDAEAITATDDVKYLTPRKLKLGFSISLAQNGYIKFPSWLGGLTLQWGLNVSNQTANATVTRNFPTPFSNSCFVVVGSYYNSGTPTTKAETNVYNWNTTTFQYNFGSSGLHGLSYFAIGY